MQSEVLSKIESIMKLMPLDERESLMMDLYYDEAICDRELARAALGVDSTRYETAIAEAYNDALEDRFYSLSSVFLAAQARRIRKEMEE